MSAMSQHAGEHFSEGCSVPLFSPCFHSPFPSMKCEVNSEIQRAMYLNELLHFSDKGWPLEAVEFNASPDTI